MATFSKKLTKTDVETRFSVKTKCLEFFPLFGQRAQVLRVEDEGGRDWFFKLIVRSGKYKKPVLSNGWREFVKTKELKIGDEVEFSIEGLQYKIRVVKKEVKLFGAVINQ